MLASKKRLRVYPNPFSASLDHEGRPCGVYQADPDHYPGVRHIGATVKSRMVKKVGEGAASQNSRYDVTMTYSMAAPTELVNTPHHRDAISTEQIIAADEATAKIAGIQFRDPATVLAGHRKRVVAEWLAQHGEEPDTAGWGNLEIGAASAGVTGSAKGGAK
jgi:hypothetical protein